MIPMKYLKTTGIAAGAAMALLAWLGAGTASANLCTETPAGGVPCPVAERVNATTNKHVQMKFTHSILFTPGNTHNPLATCKSGGLTATMQSNTTAKIEVLTFADCVGPVPIITSPGTLHVVDGGSHKGSVYATGTEMTVSILGVSCTYGVSGASTLNLGSIAGGTMIVGTMMKKTAGSFLCPSEVGYDSSYHLETPQAIYWINAGT
jgi:hypothetical protein